MSAGGPPARWRSFLVTATVIVVLQTLVSAALGPLVGGWPSLARSALTIVVVVALMTWWVMPWVTRLLRGWLSGSAGRG